MSSYQLVKNANKHSDAGLSLEKTSLKRSESIKPTPVLLPQKAKKNSNSIPPLMIQVSQGNRTVYENLCCKYNSAVAAYFRPHVGCMATVDDLTQEVFCRVWHKRECYRAGTPDLPYLRGFAVYVLKNHRDKRKCKLNVRLDYDLNSIVDTIQASPLDQTDLQEQIQILRNLLADLPGKQRQALLLTSVKGLSNEEASKEMGCSEKTVRGYCCRGLAQLRARLE